MTEPPHKGFTPELLRKSSQGGPGPVGLDLAWSKITQFFGLSKGMGRHPGRPSGMGAGTGTGTGSEIETGTCIEAGSVTGSRTGPNKLSGSGISLNMGSDTTMGMSINSDFL